MHARVARTAARCHVAGCRDHPIDGSRPVLHRARRLSGPGAPHQPRPLVLLGPRRRWRRIDRSGRGGRAASCRPDVGPLALRGRTPASGAGPRGTGGCSCRQAGRCAPQPAKGVAGTGLQLLSDLADGDAVSPYSASERAYARPDDCGRRQDRVRTPRPAVSRCGGAGGFCRPPRGVTVPGSIEVSSACARSSTSGRRVSLWRRIIRRG